MSNNKNILITGGTRGLGLEYARYLARQGYNIGITDISETACQVYGEVESVKDILTSIREGYTICIVNMLPLKDKDSIGLKRAIDKLKKTVEANDGDIAAFGEHWLVVTPSVARVYRASRAIAQESEEPDSDDTGSVQVY